MKRINIQDHKAIPLCLHYLKILVCYFAFMQLKNNCILKLVWASGCHLGFLTDRENEKYGDYVNILYHNS